MDKETEAWYENQFELFNQKGWKDCLEKAKEMTDAYNDIRNLNTSDDLWLNKGRLDMLDWLLTWEESVNKAFEDLSNE